MAHLKKKLSEAWYSQSLSVGALDENHSAYQTGFKPRQHYIRITLSVLSVSSLCETSHFFDDNKVIGHPGHDTMSSRGWLATKPQISYTPSVRKSTALGRLRKRIYPRETVPIMLTTGTQIDPVTRVARNPRLFPPVDPECWSIAAAYRELLRLSVHFLLSEGLPN